MYSFNGFLLAGKVRHARRRRDTSSTQCTVRSTGINGNSSAAPRPLSPSPRRRRCRGVSGEPFVVCQELIEHTFLRDKSAFTDIGKAFGITPLHRQCLEFLHPAGHTLHSFSRPLEKMCGLLQNCGRHRVNCPQLIFDRYHSTPSETFYLQIVLSIIQLNRQEIENLIKGLYYDQKKTFREIKQIVRKSKKKKRY